MHIVICIPIALQASLGRTGNCKNLGLDEVMLKAALQEYGHMACILDGAQEYQQSSAG